MGGIFYEKFIIEYFVKKPVLYVFLLTTGCIFFTFTSLLLKVPIYETYHADIINEKNDTLLIIDNDVTFDETAPIFIFEARDLYIYKVTNYKRTKTGIRMKTQDFKLSTKTNINIDVLKDEKSLLYVIFYKGGNT